MLVNQNAYNQKPSTLANKKSINNTPHFKGKLIIGDVIRHKEIDGGFSFAWYNWLDEVKWKVYQKVKSPTRMLMETLKDEGLLKIVMKKTEYSHFDRKEVPSYTYESTKKAIDNLKLGDDTKKELENPNSPIRKLADAIKKSKYDVGLIANYPDNIKAPILLHKVKHNNETVTSLGTIGNQINGHDIEDIEKLSELLNDTIQKRIKAFLNRILK